MKNTIVIVGSLFLSMSCAWMYLDVQHDRRKEFNSDNTKSGFIATVVVKFCKRDKDYFAVVTDNAETVVLTEKQYNELEMGKTYFFEGTVKYQPSIIVDTIMEFNGTKL